VRDGRIAGALVGVGAIVGVGFVLLRSKKTSSSASRSPRESQLPVGWFDPLVERWRGEVQKRAGDLPVDAILEWIQIESRGDTCAPGMSTEVGIFQLNFPDDAKYGATPEGLRAICVKSKLPGFDISQLSSAELDMEVGAGINKIFAARDTVRRVFAQAGMRWPESSADFGSAVKQIHAAPAVITELVPKIVRRDGSSPANWDDLRRRVMTFPVEQMSGLDKRGRPYGLRALALAPSHHGLKNRLEDTLANAEFVGHAWGAAHMSARSAPSRGNYA
jgi:hypothetical protein